MIGLGLCKGPAMQECVETMGPAQESTGDVQEWDTADCGFVCVQGGTLCGDFLCPG